jgi:hypothetical protein
MAQFSVPPAGETYDPIGYLSAFLHSLEDQLRETLEEQPGDLIPVEFHQLALDAFDPVPRELALMRDALGGRDLLSSLERHGLTGPSLVFKLALIEAQSRRYETSRRGPIRPARGLFKKLLEFIDILLESLSAALGVGGLVAEFKKGIEKAVPDDFGEVT